MTRPPELAAALETRRDCRDALRAYQVDRIETRAILAEALSATMTARGILAALRAARRTEGALLARWGVAP